MSSTVKTAIFWVVMLCTAILLWRVVHSTAGPQEEEYTYSQFRAAVVEGKVKEVTITNAIEVEGELTDGTMVKTVLPSDYPGIIDLLSENQVQITVQQSSTERKLTEFVAGSRLGSLGQVQSSLRQSRNR